MAVQEPVRAALPVPFRTPAIDDSQAMIDLVGIWRAIRRYWWAILLVTLCVCAATYGLFRITPPSYRAIAVLVLERQSEDVIPDGEGRPLSTDSPTVDTAVKVLSSSDIIGRVVDTLGLTREAALMPPPVQGAAATPDERRQLAIRLVQANLEITREGVSYAINVSATAPRPQLAARIANGVIEAYIAAQRQARSGTMEQSGEMLADRLDQLRQQVINAEAAVADYRAGNRLFAASDVSSVTQQELSSLNGQLAEAQAAEASAAARLSSAQRQVAGGMSAVGIGEALNSPTMSALKARRADASSALAQASSRYGNLHPDVIKAREALADTDEQIEEEAARILANLSAEANVASQRRSSIAGSIGRLESRLATDSEASVRLSALERNAESARNLYSSFLDSYHKNLALQGTESNGAAAVLRAPVPSAPYSPSPLVYSAAALGLSGLLAGLMLLLLNMRERGIETAGQIEAALGMRAMGSIPEIGTLPGISRRSSAARKPYQFVLDYPNSAFAESFRVLRTSLFRAPGQEKGVVAFTSALPGEGKTTAAICFARASAAAGVRTVLVDCDSRRAAITRTLLPTFASGLADVLTGRATLDDALVRDTPSGAFLLPQQPDHPTRFELLGSGAMVQLLGRLREQFDLVVIDTAPVLPVAESRVVASLADKVLFLVRWRETPTTAAQLGLRYLKDIGAPVAGVALTLVNVSEQARYGTGDAGRYFNRFKEYYR